MNCSRFGPRILIQYNTRLYYSNSGFIFAATEILTYYLGAEKQSKREAPPPAAAPAPAPAPAEEPRVRLKQVPLRATNGMKARAASITQPQRANEVWKF